MPIVEKITPEQRKTPRSVGFPLQAEGGRPASIVPWAVAEVAYAEYVEQFGSSQSLEVLANRGGFGRDEFVTLLRHAQERAGHDQQRAERGPRYRPRWLHSADERAAK